MGTHLAYQLWTLTYLTDRSAPKDAADWHDRWVSGVIVG